MSAPTTGEHSPNPEYPTSPENPTAENPTTEYPRAEQPAGGLAGWQAETPRAADPAQPRADQVPPKVKNAIIAGGIGLAVGFGLLGFGAGYVVGHDNSSGQNQMRGPGMNGGGMPGMNGGGMNGGQMPGMNGGTGQNGQLPFGQNGQLPNGQQGQIPNGQQGQTPNGQMPNGQTPNGQAPNGQQGQTGQAGTQTS